VITDALVHRVLLSGGRCTAVQYSVGGKLAIAECAGGGEVVLAAGTVGSAQRLLLSGIGPSAQLREHGISWRLRRFPVARRIQFRRVGPAPGRCRLDGQR
jgi:choline dehydrogenase